MQGSPGPHCAGTTPPSRNKISLYRDPLDRFKLVQLGPHSTGPPPPQAVMFKLVHYKPPARAVPILLECFLVKVEYCIPLD